MKHLIILNGNAGSFTSELEEKAAEAFKGLDYEIYKTTDFDYGFSGYRSILYAG